MARNRFRNKDINSIVKYYIEEKNRIVKNQTGVILIPKNQIKNTPLTKEMLIEMQFSIGAELVGLYRHNCPYCILYADNGCIDCPMYQKGNDCKKGISTYQRVINFKDPEILQITKEFVMRAKNLL